MRLHLPAPRNPKNTPVRSVKLRRKKGWLKKRIIRLRRKW